MNHWRARLIAGLVFWLVMQSHGYSTEQLPNTPQGMFWFHGSAALLDLFLMYGIPKILSGRLCDDLQVMCIASIVVNFLGWIAYLSHADPIFYNTLSWGLAYAQWGRLLLVDRHDVDRLGFNLVRGAGYRIA